ncbi:NAD(P)-binding protein [Trichoderma barbatum]
MCVQDKIVIVTGGLSGLGAATVKLMSSLGASIAVFDLQLPKDSPAGDSISQTHRFFKVDVSKTEQVAEAVQAVVAWSKQTSKPIAAVVCCAGYLGPAKILSKNNSPLSLEIFKKVVDISLTGTVDVIRQMVPHMSTQPTDENGSRGVIITVSSAAAFDGQEGQVSYSAAKGAIASMTLPLARDLSRWGIRAVCIAPGMFDTGMVEGMPDKARESLKKTLEFPARAGKPEEFAGMVKSVVENVMLNGTVIRLDGAARMPSRL